jgi:hypothetical protein
VCQENGNTDHPYQKAELHPSRPKKKPRIRYDDFLWTLDRVTEQKNMLS